MTEEEARRQGYEAITFRYIDGFAEADPGFELIILGRTVSYGDTPVDALQALLDELADLKRFKEDVVKLTERGCVSTLHRSQSGYPISP